MSWFSDFFGGATQSKDQGFPWGSVVASALPGVITTIGELNKPEAYGQSEQYLRDKMAQDQAQFIASLEAQKQIAQIGSGDARAIARMNAIINMAALKERVGANALAAKLKATQGIPEVLTQAASGVTNAMQNKGALGQRGFSEMASNLGVYR